jgi:8-oxo-dGTP diphosphatase
VSDTLAKPRRTRIAAYAIIVRDGAILLARLSDRVKGNTGKWTLPGGGIEFGEDPAHAAVREVKEETGYDVLLRDLLEINNLHVVSPDAEHHGIRILYSADIVGGTLTHETDNSTDRCEWIPLDGTAQIPLVDIAQRAVEIARRDDPI